MQLAQEDLIASTIAAICAAKCNYLVIFIVGLLLGLLPSQSRAAEPYIQMYLSCDPPGRCPEYRIAVYEDKRVWFQGINSVEAVGERWASISLDALLALKQKVMKADFFQRLDEYPFMANLPHRMDIQIRVNDGTKTKTIKYTDHYRPDGLDEIVESLSAIARVNKWVCPFDVKERRRVCLN